MKIVTCCVANDNFEKVVITSESEIQMKLNGQDVSVVDPEIGLIDDSSK